MALSFAFIAGLLTFLDPCVIATVPLYLGYLALQPRTLVPAGARELEVFDQPGSSTASAGPALAPATGRWTLVRRSLAFIAGFSTLFILVGIGVAVLGRSIAPLVPWMYYIGAILTILVGVALLGWLVRPLSALSDRLRVLPFIRSPHGAYTLGLALAVAWIPCAGPIMAVVAGASGLFSQIGTALAFLALFCAGLAVPFLVAAFFGEAVLTRLRALSRFVKVVTAITGVLMIGIGVLLLTQDGYEAVEHRVEVFYEETMPGLFGWRSESQYEQWWDSWFTDSGHEEGEGEHE